MYLGARAQGQAQLELVRQEALFADKAKAAEREVVEEVNRAPELPARVMRFSLSRKVGRSLKAAEAYGRPA